MSGLIRICVVALGALAMMSQADVSQGQNRLGAWLWYLEGTGYASHDALAQKLASVGVKRIYVKVADGGYDPGRWPEVDRASIPAAYKKLGIECWAWAYNYPGNEANQGRALYQAGRAGYQGFVTDIEIEFDGAVNSLHSLMSAFRTQRDRVRAEVAGAGQFALYCTTWGNPKDHGMRVDIIDQYVDGHMPQTYLEVWGDSYMANAAYWVNAGTQEYRSLGCKKPIHHILSAEKNRITSAQLNAAIQASGAETSIWRIPGGGTDLAIWRTLERVNWAASFGTKEQLTLGEPGTIVVNVPVRFTGSASAGITRVIASVDGYTIGQPATPQSGTFSIPYTFSQAGQGRTMVVRGFNGANVEVARLSRAINVSPAQATVSATVPAGIRVGTLARFTGAASSGVATVRLAVDGYVIGETAPTGGAWSLVYVFSSAGNQRRLTVTGLNAAGAAVASVEYLIAVLANAAYLEDVPYFYQYSNAINPSGSCQNTTQAMVLKYYAQREGKGTVANQITPDSISAYWGTSYAQTVAGYQDQFNREAAYRGLAVRDRGFTAASLSQLQNLIAVKKPVVVHGYFTAYGHLMVVLGYDGSHYYVHDPAGRWSQHYASGGYSGTNPSEGKLQKYRKDAFERAILVDGTIWLHDFR